MRGQIHIREEPGGSSPKRSLSQVLPEKGNDQLELTELADKLMDEACALPLYLNENAAKASRFNV